MATSSKSAANRKTGKHQVDEQRESILNAAQALFLQNGLENTSMIDIASRAGITRVTLYRYFANRDAIALEIHVRMLNKITSLVPQEEEDLSLEHQRHRAQSMIRNFSVLRDAFRYIGMFDKVYLDNPPETALTKWTKNRLTSLTWSRSWLPNVVRENPQGNQIAMVMNNVTWFLEKLALRGELTWSDKDTPLEVHLKMFEDMIMGYFDRLEEEKKL